MHDGFDSAELIPNDPADTIEDIADAILAGEEIGFYAEHHDRSRPPPFTLRHEDGGFKVRGARGQHLGSFADLDAAWAEGMNAAERMDAARDPWGRGYAATLANLKR